MKKILFINIAQFGYHTDYNNYVSFLKKRFDITYVCFDQKKKHQDETDVNIKYVPIGKSRILSKLRFVLIASKEARRCDFIFIKHFNLSSLILFLTFSNRKSFHLDIRSGSVHNKLVPRIILNTFLRVESSLFPSISVISDSLARKLSISRYFLLPLGRYVGTFYNRDLDVAISGFKLFYEQYKHSIEVTWTIIGDISSKEYKTLSKLVTRLELTHIISFIGYVPNNKLGSYFESHNIGISFVPITSYYNCQPPTKILEYALAGLFTIATNTIESEKLINDTNGILCEDTIDGFYKALCLLKERKETINSNEIFQSLHEHSWEIILKKYLNPILDS